MIGISGIRGIVGETFTPELITRLGSSFGTYCSGGKVIVGRDTRVSGEMVKHSLLGGLISTGCQVIDIGICPTPSLTIMIDELDVDGGVMISASHNPIEWNALKFYDSSGIILDEDAGKDFLSVYYLGDFDHKPWDGIHDVTYDHSTAERHLERIYTNTDIEAVRKAAPKVVIDSCNGAGSIITPRMLEHMGCDTVKLHCEPDGLFPHNPEPVFKNLQDLSETVLRENADIGFAQDADADRIAVVSEKGEIIGEEMSLALAVDHVLSQKTGPVVTNMSTSKVIADIADRYGADLHITPVGEVNVAKKMKEVGAVIGGEGNGGVICPVIGSGRDSLAAVSIILEMCVQRDKPVSEIAAGFPRYEIVKQSIECPRGETVRILKEVEKKYGESRVDTSDGLKIYFEHSWVHIRRSATEPIVRIISEASDREHARSLNTEFRDLMLGLIGK